MKKDMNDKSEIRNGWYKIKNQKDLDKEHKLISSLEEDLPKHRIIGIVRSLWDGWLIQPEAILHEYFNYGDIVYVRNCDAEEWKKAKYLNYSNERFSHMAVVDNCSTAWNYC